MVHTHADLRLLIDSLNTDEREYLLQHECSLFFSSEHADLLLNKSTLTARQVYRRLKISEKLYKEVCDKTYTGLCRFLLYNRHFTPGTVEQEISEAQLLSDFYKERGLFAEAKSTLERAINTARHYELCGRETALQHQYLQTTSYSAVSSDEKKRLVILQRIEWLSRQQYRQEELHNIYYHLLLQRYKSAYRTSPDEQKEIIQLQSKLQAYSPSEINSTTVLIYYYQALLLADFMLGNTDHILMRNERLLACWQRKSHLIKIHPELFIQSMSLQSYTHFLIKDIAAVENSSNQYKALLNSNLPSPFYKNWFAIVDFQTTLKVLHKTYEYKKLAVFFIQQWPHTYAQLSMLRDAERLDLLLSACITFFVLEQWDEAEATIQEAKELNQKVKRLDTLYFSFVFHSLILYEKKEWHRLDSLIHAGYHFLYSHKTLRPFEKDMLLFIKKLPASRFKGMATENIKAFLNKLDSYRENPTQKLHFASFDFYSWFESKVAGVSYSNYMRNKSNIDSRAVPG